MDRARLQQVRDRIAAEPAERLDMRSWPSCRSLHECNTAACIGGWGAFVRQQEEGGDGRSAYPSCVGDWLGLTFAQADALFQPPGWSRNIYTQADALAALDSLINAPTEDALPVWPERVQEATL